MFVAGRAADDIGLQCGGWTIEWRGIPGGDIPGTTLLQAIRRAVSDGTEVVYEAEGNFGDETADVGLVVIAEPPYAEMTGDRADLTLPPEDTALIERMRSQCRTLICIFYSGRPLIVTDELEATDAFVAAWLPGSEGDGMADVLFGDVPFTGRLPVAWPRDMSQVPKAALEASDRPPLWPRGHGLGVREEISI
jgi:beta-glucosidase